MALELLRKISDCEKVDRYYEVVVNFFKRIFRKARKKMGDKETKEVYMDAEYNAIKAMPNSVVRLKEFSDYQIEKYRATINEEKMNRYLKDLSSPLLDHEKVGPFLYFYLETRNLYREGFFHSCIAMCRITAERISKALVDLGNISDEDKERFLRLRFYDLIWVMFKLNIIKPDIFADLDNIRNIDNNYIHPKGGIDSSLDSENVINSLGRLINRTSNIFNEYEMIQGKLVAKVKKKCGD